MRWPIDGNPRISQEFGENPAYYKKWGLNGHNGRDFAVVVGTPVYCADWGTVERVATDKGGYGLFCVVRHEKNKTLYAHLDAILVPVDCYVTKGQQVARSGNTGNSTGPHLHFEVIDPKQMSNGFKGRIDPRLVITKEEPKNDRGTEPTTSPATVGNDNSNNSESGQKTDPPADRTIIIEDGITTVIPAIHRLVHKIIYFFVKRCKIIKLIRQLIINKK